MCGVSDREREVLEEKKKRRKREGTEREEFEIERFGK